MSNNKGTISKNDLLVHVKNSKIWKGFLESKTKNNTTSPNVAAKVSIIQKLFFSCMKDSPDLRDHCMHLSRINKLQQLLKCFAFKILLIPPKCTP